MKELRNTRPIQKSTTQRLMMNQCGKRGPHFDAALQEFPSLLFKRSAGCCLLQGPFAAPPSVALSKKVLSGWGSKFRLHKANTMPKIIIKAEETHLVVATFLSTIQGHDTRNERRMGGQASLQSSGRAVLSSSGVLTGIQPICRIDLAAFGLAGGLAKGLAGGELFRGPTA